MNAQLFCELKGSYKVDLYSGVGANRTKVESTEWFDNAITCSGLNYPYVYSFADCFRFLSLGTGTTWNNGALDGNQVRTGLRNPLTGFQTFDGFNSVSGQSAQYIGWQGYEIGGPHDESYANAQSSSCGSKFTNNGISLYRGWTIPTGAIENGTVSNETINITSFMVSPSSGSDPTGRGAFSIADRNVTLPSGFTATIFYQLSLDFLNFKTPTFFSGKNDGNGWFNTGNASTGVNGSELPLLSGWSNLSGVYRQVLPGLQMVDALGASIIPVWGDQMEPKYRQCKKLYFYLSPDNMQFAVSYNGQPPTSESGAYNADGLMGNYTKIATGGAFIHSDKENEWPSEPDKWYYSGQSQSDAKSVLTNTFPTNIRLENLLSIANYNTNLDTIKFNYQTDGFVSPRLEKWETSYASRGKEGFNENEPDYGQRAIFSTYLRTLPNSGLSTPTGTPTNPNRSRKVSRTAYFSPINSMGINSQYASLVLAHLNSPGTIGEMTFMPYIDFLFFDTSGRSANSPHYRLIPDIYLNDRGSGVSSIRFDIVNERGEKPSSINRFHSVYGFMGPGVDYNNPNTPSGLDVNHEMFTKNIQVGNESLSSGYAFAGAIPSQTTSGSTTDNGGTGWGCVYGIIANTGFYQRRMDTALIDKANYSEFSASNSEFLTIPSGTHGSILLNGYFYGGTVNSATNINAQDYIWKVNVENLQDFQVIPSPIGIVPAMTFCTGNGKLYAIGTSGCIGEISTGASLSASLVKGGYSSPGARNFHAITNDGRYLYACLASNNAGYVYSYDTQNSLNTSGFVLLGAQGYGGGNFYCHSASYDGQHVYVTNSNTPASIVKIQPGSIVGSNPAIGTGVNISSNSIISDDNTLLNGYFFAGLESGSDGKYIFKVNTSTMTIAQSGYIGNYTYGLTNDGKYIYSACSDSKEILKISPENLSIVKRIPTKNNLGFPNEVHVNGNNIYTTFWAVNNNIPPSSGTEFARISLLPPMPDEYDESLLFWPTQDEKINLRITGVKYYSPIAGEISDPSGIFRGGQNQLISDVIYTGSLLGDNSSKISDYATASLENGDYGFILVSGSGVPVIPVTSDETKWTYLSQLKATLSGSFLPMHGKKISLRLNATPGYCQLLGFNPTSEEIGYGLGWSSNGISQSYLIPSGFGPKIDATTGIFLAYGRFENISQTSSAPKALLSSYGTPPEYKSQYYKITGITGIYDTDKKVNLVDVIKNNSSSEKIYLHDGTAPVTYASLISQYSDNYSVGNHLELTLYKNGVPEMALPVSFANDYVNPDLAYLSAISGITDTENPIGYGKNWNIDDVITLSVNINQNLDGSTLSLMYSGTSAHVINTSPDYAVSFTGAYKIITGGSLTDGVNIVSFTTGAQIYLATGEPQGLNDFLPYLAAASNVIGKFENSATSETYSFNLYSSNCITQGVGNKAKVSLTNLSGIFLGKNHSLTEDEILSNVSFSDDFGTYKGQAIKAYTYDANAAYDTSLFTPITETESLRCVPSVYKQPEAVIHHVEHVNGSGYRLLPNYAQPNNLDINYYSPVRGGSFPSMSIENGLQMFCDFVWSGG